MFTKNQSSQKNNLTELFLNKRSDKVDFAHHAFLIKGNKKADYYTKLILEQVNFIGKPLIFEENTFTIENTREVSINSQKKYKQDDQLLIIVRAQSINKQAQNALLKTLENPPKFVTFIIILPDISGVLETILSRVFIINDESHNKEMQEEALNFLSCRYPDRLKEIERILNRYEKDEIDKIEINSFVDEVMEQSMEGKSASQKINLLKIKELLNNSNSHLKQILEGLAISA